MCGRYLVDEEVYADMWMILNGSKYEPESGKQSAASREVFPANIAPVVTNAGFGAIKWGFPQWKGKGLIINARAETALEKKMFSKPLSTQRCVVPSSGFYEWARAGSGNPDPALQNRADSRTKPKYLFRRPGETLLFMAGIADAFLDASGEEYSAFVILTTAANESVLNIHDRMPVILAPEERDLWIHDDDFMNRALHRIGFKLDSQLV